MTDISLVNPVNVLLSLPTQCYNNKCLPPLWLFTWSELMASCLQGRHLVNWSISSASPSLTHHHFLWMNSDALVDFNLSFFYHSTKLPILSTFFFFYQKSNISERFFFFSELCGTAKHLLLKKTTTNHLDFWVLETQTETCLHPAVERLFGRVTNRPGPLCLWPVDWLSK